MSTVTMFECWGCNLFSCFSIFSNFSINNIFTPEMTSYAEYKSSSPCFDLKNQIHPNSPIGPRKSGLGETSQESCLRHVRTEWSIGHQSGCSSLGPGHLGLWVWMLGQRQMDGIVNPCEWMGRSQKDEVKIRKEFQGLNLGSLQEQRKGAGVPVTITVSRWPSRCPGDHHSVPVTIRVTWWLPGAP